MSLLMILNLRCVCNFAILERKITDYSLYVLIPYNANLLEDLVGMITVEETVEANARQVG